MTTDLYSTVFFQDGEQFTFDDANNMQRFARAQLTDQVLQQLIGDLSNAATRPEFGADGGADASSLWAYCVSPGRAFLRQGSANNKIQLAPGTLLQKIANADGADSTLVPFTFAGTEEWTIASGDATNPRVDVLQMKLEYITDTLASVDFQDQTTRANTTTPNTPTRRRIQCTLSVKTGTPAASPTIPDPDTGFVPVATAVVGHGWTSAGAAPIFGVDTAESNNVVIHDQRMPMNLLVHRVDPVLYKLETAWALASTNQCVTASSGTNKMYAICPSRVGRLVAVDLRYSTALAAGAVTLGFWQNPLAIGAPSTAYTPKNKFVPSYTFPSQSNPNRALRFDVDGRPNPPAGPTISPSAVSKIGVPLWSCGYRVPQVPAGQLEGFLALGVVNQTNATSIGEVVIHVAV